MKSTLGYFYRQNIWQTMKRISFLIIISRSQFQIYVLNFLLSDLTIQHFFLCFQLLGTSKLPALLWQFSDLPRTIPATIFTNCPEKRKSRISGSPSKHFSFTLPTSRVAFRRQVSISPTFYTSLFITKVPCAAFRQLQFGCLNFFWPKNIGAKAACKMLMKLEIGFNFTDILLHELFVQKCFARLFSSYSSAS